MVKRVHVLVLSVTLALAAVVGVVVVSRTVQIGPSATAKISPQTIDQRNRALDRVEASLRDALAKRPPALPALPAETSIPTAAPVRVVYRRPAPVVRASGRDDDDERDHEEHEHEDGEGD